MVNIFLTGTFLETANTLDKARLFKQVVEAKQIINIITNKNNDPNIKVGFEHHPCVKMWQPYLNALKVYYNTMLNFSILLHNTQTTMDYYTVPEVSERPWFIDYAPLIYSHRARLYQKDPIYYKDKFVFPEEYLKIGYIWTNRFPYETYINAKNYDDIKLLADPLDERYLNAKYCCGIFKSGKNKGLVCGRLLKSIKDDYCGIHNK